MPVFLCFLLLAIGAFLARPLMGKGMTYDLIALILSTIVAVMIAAGVNIPPLYAMLTDVFR